MKPRQGKKKAPGKGGLEAVHPALENFLAEIAAILGDALLAELRGKGLPVPSPGASEVPRRGIYSSPGRPRRGSTKKVRERPEWYGSGSPFRETRM